MELLQNGFATPFSSNSIGINESYVTSVIAALTQTDFDECEWALCLMSPLPNFGLPAISDRRNQKNQLRPLQKITDMIPEPQQPTKYQKGQLVNPLTIRMVLSLPLFCSGRTDKMPLLPLSKITKVDNGVPK